MSILRNKLKDRFVQVPNELVTDNRISIPARLIYVYLLSKPDGWIVRNGDVMKSLDIRNSGTMAKYWHELEMSGWIIRHKTSAGTYDYELSEAEPVTEKPNVGKTAIAKKPNVGKTTNIYNTDSFNNTEELSNKETSNKIQCELAERINALFCRRSTTAWSVYEMRKLKEVAGRAEFNFTIENRNEVIT